ncbi:MAG: hypothetical protein Q9214_004109 [Letrouitia sp. 1 TL-2023]
MVGPWQIPLADVAVTATSLTAGIKTGEAMAVGEKPPLALISPAASARMAVAEALMNIAAADILDGLPRIRLSANWMAASNHPGEGAALYEAVEAIGMHLCPELGISIPVGKDSMSMKMQWKDRETNEAKEVTAPLSLVVSAFAPVANIREIWTPALRRMEDNGGEESILMLVDLAEGHRALGGSAVAQVFNQTGNEAPDVRNLRRLKDYFDAIQQLHQEPDLVMAYHDISDGGLFTCLVEMAIAGRCGLEIMLDELSPNADKKNIIPALFNEELGAIFQVRKKDEINFIRCFATCGPPEGLIKKIGRVPPLKENPVVVIYHGHHMVYRSSRSALQQCWSSTSHSMQRLRDNPACSDAEFESILDEKDPGLSYLLTFNPAQNILPFTSSLSNRLSLTSKPRVAILREQGINGDAEMAFAFMTAGFSAIDVHMTDLLTGRVSLSDFVGLAACGGFSYGDCLGAGQGWSKSVLLHQVLRVEFKKFFERKDTFTFAVCNGCQFIVKLKSLIPGAEGWPNFVRNESEQYEARTCMVEVLDNSSNPSVFLHGMKGSKLPVAVAHGEGRAHFSQTSSQQAAAQSLMKKDLVPLRYVDNYLKPTERYPANPNGSPLGIAGVRSPDGRVFAVMPHPERTVLGDTGSWIPPGDANDAFWLAQVHFSTGNYTRALGFLTRHSLLEHSPSCRYLAAHCHIKQSKFEEALTVLGEKSPTHLIASTSKSRRKLQHKTGGPIRGKPVKTLGNGRPDRIERSEERERENPSDLKYEAGMCYLRGICFAKQNAFDRAKECYKDAVRIDVQCFEAFDQLMKNSLMPPEEEWAFLESLDFESITTEDSSTSQEAAEFVKMLYTTRLSKYKQPHSFNNAIETLSTHYNLKSNPDLLLSKAELYFTQCRFKQALHITSSILEADEYNFAIYPLHLACLHELNQTNTLFLLSHRLADLHPDEPATWLAVGVYYLSINQVSESRRFFSKASMMDPHFGPAWIGFAHTFAAEGEHDQAISAYSTAARLFQGTHLPQLFLGMQNLQLNNMTLAQEYLNAAHQLCSTDPLLLNELGVVFYHLDHLPDAISLFRRALAIAATIDSDPRAWIATRANLGHAYRRQQQFSLALQEFEEVIRQGLKECGIFSAKGLVLLEMGRTWDAVVCFHEALGVSPQDPVATDLLSRALEENALERGGTEVVRPHRGLRTDGGQAAGVVVEESGGAWGGMDEEGDDFVEGVLEEKMDEIRRKARRRKPPAQRVSEVLEGEDSMIVVSDEEG